MSRDAPCSLGELRWGRHELEVKAGSFGGLRV